MNLKDIKIMLIKGQKGDKGADGYDDTELRQMIADEAAAREAEIAQMETNYLDYMYPVGSIYMSVGNTSPAVLFGGTWAKIEGKFLLASSSTYTNGATGGSATHTPSGTVGGHALTDKEIAPHDHGYYRVNYTYPNESTYHLNNDAQHAYFDFNAHDHTGNMYAGDGTVITEAQAHTHPFTGTSQDTMPPYLAVNVWKRTA